MKRLLEEMQERGWTTAGDGFVCPDCVDDDALAEHLAAHAEAFRCDYCERSSDAPIAAPVDELVAVIHAGLASEYGDANEEGLPYESREGGWQGEVQDAYDLLWGTLTDERLLADVSGAMADTIWVQRDYWRLRPHQALAFGWERFCDVVTHRHRFLFAHVAADPDDPDDLSPIGTLAAVARAILDAGLVRDLPAGTQLFRAQTHSPSERLTGAARLGAPPLEFARTANRMSPAGIAMFYAATDASTAAIEAASADPNDPAVATIGRFETLRDLRVVDLSDPPPPPSLFDSARRAARQPLMFLGGFAGDLSREVRRDGAEHVEYVPTQIVTEYLRDAFDAGPGAPLLGLMYSSARQGGLTNCVLWIANDDACDPEDLSDREHPPWLVLRDMERRELS